MNQTRDKNSASPRSRVALGIGAIVVFVALTLAGCGVRDELGSETSEGGGGGGGTSSTVPVTLQEWSVVPGQDSTQAGEVTFAFSNKGKETHEFVVVKTDLANRELPTSKDGSVDEEGAGIEPVDEVEDVPSGKSGELTVDLAAGHYVVFCNVVEKEEGSHYQNGMSADFDVQ